MSCPDHQVLSAFADRELHAAELAEVQHHLAGCASCQQFVDEMRRLDARGRSSLQAISVPTRPNVIALAKARGRPYRLLRPITLAAAAIIFVSLTAWFVTHTLRERQQTLTPFAAPDIQAHESANTNQKLAVSPDAAFERWAEPYRALRIPLVPMEDLANYKPAQVHPIQPASTL